MYVILVRLKPGFHSNACNTRNATQALALRAMHKRKTQALALATMIGCFNRAFLLAGTCIRCVKIESVLSLRFLT